MGQLFYLFLNLVKQAQFAACILCLVFIDRQERFQFCLCLWNLWILGDEYLPFLFVSCDFSRQLFLLFLERLYFTIVLFSLAGKILLLFLLQFQQILLGFQKLREFRGGFLKLSVVGMIRMGRAATERTRFAFGQVGTMNLPFFTCHQGVGFSQRQGLLGQSLDGQLAQGFIYLRISLAQDQDALLILLLFCCGSIEMSHYLDGLLDILQFPVGYSLAVLQFLYILSGSLVLFRLPSLFCGLCRFVQNLFLLGNLFLCRFEGKVRFLRFSFPFLDVLGVLFYVFQGSLILFLRQLQCLFLFFQIRHSRFHFCFQRPCFSDDRQCLFQLFLCQAYCFLQTGESFLAFIDGRLLTFDVSFRFQDVFFLLVDALRLSLYFLQQVDGWLYFIVQLQTENLGLHLFDGICCLFHICLADSDLIYLLIVFLKPLQVF